MQRTIVHNILIQLILTYQKYLSPYKGYCCAHSVLHGNSSCSSWAVRILKKQRVSLLLPLMKRRFQACNQAHEKLKTEKSKTSKKSDTVDPCPCSDKPMRLMRLTGHPQFYQLKTPANPSIFPK